MGNKTSAESPGGTALHGQAAEDAKKVIVATAIAAHWKRKKARARFLKLREEKKVVEAAQEAAASAMAPAAEALQQEASPLLIPHNPAEKALAAAAAASAAPSASQPVQSPEAQASDAVEPNAAADAALAVDKPSSVEQALSAAAAEAVAEEQWSPSEATPAAVIAASATPAAAAAEAPVAALVAATAAAPGATHDAAPAAFPSAVSTTETLVAAQSAAEGPVQPAQAASVPFLAPFPADQPVSSLGAAELPSEASGAIDAPDSGVPAATVAVPLGGKEAKEGKQRTLEQMMSLKPGDDERTELSKKISWILRHGAKKVNVGIDAEGWVLVNDLLASDILSGTGEQRLLDVINESNQQKTRYELKEVPQSGTAVRAISKSRRTNTGARERRRREAEGSGAEAGPPREPREPGLVRGRGGPSSPGADGVGEGGHGPGQWTDDGPTFRQQQQMGFRPVYQGNQVVAMIRGDETVRPGRREGVMDSKGVGGDRRGGGFKGRGRTRGEDEIGKGGPGHEGMGRMDSFQQNRQQRWRVIHGQEAIVREAVAVESEVVATLLSGTIVIQLSEDKILKNGIVRMLVEAIEPQQGIKGWVTRSAEAAGGPMFFKPHRGDRDRNMGGRGKGGKGFLGKGKRPIGEGEGSFLL